MGAAAKSDRYFATYQNVALAGTMKKGILKQLDNGYYEIILGAFAAFGNGGWIYDEATAMRYIESDREFLAELKGGRMCSEWGHPVRLPGQSDADWFARICSILESNTSSHIRAINLSFNTVTDEKGRKVVAVIGEVRPHGFKADEFRLMLENPDADVAYSIRSFARRDFQTNRKHITKIITWDSVTTPGIAVASKYKTPSLESKDVTGMLDLCEERFNLERLRNTVLEATNDESFESLKHVKIITSLYEEQKRSIQVPATFNW